MIRIWEKLLGAKRRAQKWTSSLRIVDPTSSGLPPPRRPADKLPPPAKPSRAPAFFPVLDPRACKPSGLRSAPRTGEKARRCSRLRRRPRRAPLISPPRCRPPLGTSPRRPQSETGVAPHTRPMILVEYDSDRYPITGIIPHACSVREQGPMVSLVRLYAPIKRTARKAGGERGFATATSLRKCPSPSLLTPFRAKSLTDLLFCHFFNRTVS